MPTPFLPLLAATLLCVAPPQSDDVAKARLKSTLEATGLRYEASASGLSYTLAFDYPNNRRQVVYVGQAPNKVSSLVTHMIYTTVWVNKESAPDDATLRNVLSKSKKVGAFYLFKDSKGTWALRFGVHFDATDLKDTAEKGDTLSTTLKDLISFVSTVGEEVDKQLNGEKDIR
jgi:hypothetical protein